MPRVNFTYALKRFFPQISPQKVEAKDLSEVLASLDEMYPGFRSYIVDEQGALRKHVNIFLDGKLIKYRKGLSDAIDDVTEFHFVQALSGG